jgi:uncharacterized membrane protein required for colicin V production
MLYKVLTLCKILNLYVNILIISLYTYNICSIVNFIEVYFESNFFGKVFSFIKINLIQTITWFESCMNTNCFNKKLHSIYILKIKNSLNN